MTRDEILAQVDTWLVSFAPQLNSWQQNNKTPLGEFLQCKWSHSEAKIPADGAKVIPDLIAANGWPSYPGVTDVPWPAALACDEYQSGKGFGYLLRPLVVIAGSRWSRVQGVGPESWMGQAWYEQTGQ